MKELNKKLKPYILLCTYVIVLAYLLINIKSVFKLLGFILGTMSPFIIAIAISFVLNIPMKLFEEKVFSFLDAQKYSYFVRFKRPLSIAFTLLVVVGLLSTLTVFIIPQLVSSVTTLANNVPDYLNSFENFIITNLGDIQGFDKIWQDLLNAWKDILGFAGQFLGSTINHIVNITINITSSIVNFFLAIIFSIYMLSSKEKLIFQLKKVLFAYFNKRVCEKLIRIGKISNATFSSFIAGQCTEAIIIGTLCFIGMWILRIPYSLLIGFIVGVTSLIPIFGAFIGTIPSALIILLIDPWKAILFIIFIIILQQVEGHFIYPKVVGNSIGLSAIWVMFAMLVGGGTLGFLGLLIGIPLFGVIYKIFREYTNNKLISKNISLDDLSHISDSKE